MAPLIKMTAITKTFPGVIANQDVNFELNAGEIHALLGENGAGKSTLMSILTGLYTPDQGSISIKGQLASLTSPRDAIKFGIGMVHQHFRLVKPFSVAENVILGTSSEGFFLNMPEVEKKIASFSEDYGLKVDPKAKVWQLSVGEQQRVEIIKMLYRGAEIFILDEPTAVLTPQESRELFATLRRMANKGKGIIVITHKLQEVLDNADKITVLRDGKYINTFDGDKTDARQLTMAMVGRDIDWTDNLPIVPKGEPLLELRSIDALGDRGQKAVNSVSFEVRQGEIFGIAGVAGNGQKELAEVIAGLRGTLSGELIIHGRSFTGKSGKQMIDAGVSLIPEDRLGMGLVGNLNALDNSILKNYRHDTAGKGFFLNWKKIREFAQRLVSDFDIKLSSLDAPVKSLSGGNLQKLLLAREMSANPEVIVAVYPVRGLDVSAIEAVRNVLLQQRAQGKAIILISEELEELFALSDRIGVLHEGELMGVLAREQFDLEKVGMMMAGEKGVAV